MSSDALVDTVLAAHRLFRINDEWDNLFHMANEAYKIYMSTGSDFNTSRFRDLICRYTKDFKRIAEDSNAAIETFQKHQYLELAKCANSIRAQWEKNLLIHAKLQIARQDAIDTNCSPSSVAEIKRLEELFKQHQAELELRKKRFKEEYDLLNY